MGKEGGDNVKVVDLKARVYDLIAQREAVSNEMMKVNTQIAQACSKCKANPCECKKEA